MKKTLHLYIFFGLISTAAVSAFADQPVSGSATYQEDLNKLIDTSRDNIKEVNEKIKQEAILKSNQEHEEKAHEYYEKGMELTKDGKFDEARDYFEKSIGLTEYPEMAGYIKGRQDYRGDIETAYQKAIDLYNQRKYHPAQEAFKHVNEMAPYYRGTDSYLAIIDQDIPMELYAQAIELYKNKEFAEAKKKFEEINLVIPGYKATIKYLARIDRDSQQEKERIDREQQRALQEQALADEQKRAQELKDKTDQTQKVYIQALALYRDHQWERSKAQFESVEQIIPDYKRTRRYLQKIEVLLTKAAVKKAAFVVPVPKSVLVPAIPAPAPVAAVVVAPAPPPEVKAAVSLEDQQKQARDIAALAEKSTQLYRQIADIADDNPTIQTKRKMAQVDGILKNLKENKERLLRQMQEEQWKRRQKDLEAKREERRAEAEKKYQEGTEFLRSHEYAKAKIKFLELENVFPDYKATRRNLLIIESSLKKANVEAVTKYEQNQAGYLKQLQDKENAAQLRQVQEDQEKQQVIEQQQQSSLKELSQKASGINDDIIQLSKSQDYAAMKLKFAELENTVTALTTLKDEMAKEKDHQQRAKQLARESAHQRADMLSSQKKEDQRIHAYYSAEPQKEYRPILSNQPADADQYKRREIMQEQNMLFSEGVDRYEHKKYTQAKLLFGELADQHDYRAEVWLKKVDRAITQQLLRGEEAEERERTAFIADQVRAQRELIIIQERERQRQKKLTEELERQKRLYEDDRLLQLRKEEIMKAQERERQRQEEKRLQLERENQKQQELLRFHKIKAVIKPVAKPVIKPSQAVAIVPPAAPAPAIVKPPVMAVQTEQDARQKRMAQRQKERERQKQLRAQRDAERQARLKAQAEARERIKEEKQKEKERRQELKAEQARVQAEKSAQEQKRREEVLNQQEEQRQEKIKQEEIIREESQRRQELERQERERQSQLEAQREIVRKQLEDGVEAMYQDALRLYQQGEYTAAADRFKDVEDIIPDYKHAGQYMDEARTKSLIAKPQAVATDPSTPASSSVSHQDNVSKALDLFDPNAK
jgi:tetratricopeptide (TPR) repeat protein